MLLYFKILELFFWYHLILFNCDGKVFYFGSLFYNINTDSVEDFTGRGWLPFAPVDQSYPVAASICN